MMRCCSFALTLFLLFMGLLSVPVYGAPAADLWPRWQAHDPESSLAVDHNAWDAFLQRYIDSAHPSGIFRFNYKAVSPEDRQTLKNYLRQLQATRVSSLSRPEQKAFWINLYNGLTVELILEHYPVKSIREIDISPGLFSSGPWDAKLLKIEGQELSLNDIEHRILRPIWRDNRVHYAVNCASLGCPNLQPRAFTAENLETLLTKGAREFINHPRGARVDRDRPVVSSIYFWFQEDFGGSKEGIVHHLEVYLNRESIKKLRGAPKKMRHEYDWNLNE